MDRRAFVFGLASGLVAAAKRVAAQQPSATIARIGFLRSGSATSAFNVSRADAFRAGMRELGYVEGRNLVIEFRWAEGDNKRFPPLAAELVGLKVDAIVTGGGTAARAAMQATRTIPIVAVAGDIMASGVVANLARPGGNVTGATFFSPELTAKRLELLKDAVPSIREVALTLNPDNPSNKSVLQAAEETAKAIKVGLRPIYARTGAEIESALAAMARDRVDALVANEDGVLIDNATTIAAAATKHRLPSAAGRDFVEAGGLIGYGTRIAELYRHAAVYVDKILKGAKPGELPVERPIKFELVINLKTAKALGITIPQSLLLRADEVIE